MREPSLHIAENKLCLVFSKLEQLDSFSKEELKVLARAVLSRGKKYSLTNRRINVDKAKLMKSTNKLVLSTRDDSGVFANLLTLIRKKRHHKGISIIKPGSKDWLMVKEITKLANDFCVDFSLKREEGYKIYIGLCLDKMIKFSLMKFNSLHQSVCDDYSAHEEIIQDMTPNLTTQILMIYERELGQKGIVRDYRKEASKFIFFIRAKEQAKKHGVSPEDYIKAQFWGLEWANAIPDPAQLVGDKAIDRLSRYLVKHNIKPSKQGSNVADLAAKIKSEWSNGKDSRK